MIKATGCPECQSKYFMLIGSMGGEEFYRCHSCGCEWKWAKGKRTITKHRNKIVEVNK